MANVINKIAFAFISIFALLVLPACGPGTGGTGTGPILSNAPANESNGALTAASSQLTDSAVTGKWTTQDAKSIVFIEVEKITVTSNCVRYTFLGNWVVDANQSIVRQTQDNKLVIVFSNQQLSFSVTNILNETVASGTALSKISSEVTPSSAQCPNL
jgi:hypothetical protein